MLNRNFNGMRLKEGRIYRGFTITELAEYLNVSKQMVSKYENSHAEPSFETVHKIANYLDFPFHYFYEEPVNVTLGNTYFRSLLSTGKKEREMQLDRIKYITILRKMLEEYIDFPELDLLVGFDYQDDIEEFTQQLRTYWGLGDKPIKDIVFLLEERGFIISSLYLDNKSIDAFGAICSIREKEYYSIVLSSDKQSFYRRQFDVAHELGHALLHEPTIIFNDLDKEEQKQIEKEANDFAAAFLLPKESFLRDITMHPSDLDYYKMLKKKWGVSISAMLMRAYKLGAINDGTYQYMQRMISKKGWRKKEPYDDIKEVSEPIANRQAIELLIENDYFTGPELIKILSKEYGLTIHPSEIESLLGLEKGYLLSKEEPVTNNIVQLKTIRNMESC
ncbi:helix-turn-helix domain-containing protein [Lysinibacillus piscis]|uniref:helix-turn-helix domain-containing protein n=1 Tax=Lysinibacillus piscis TaxID=2518931 RepID=UPI00222E2237|nr:XRE family transcriptional regulator [Lysinibacillus sp. KH24]